MKKIIKKATELMRTKYVMFCVISFLGILINFAMIAMSLYNVFAILSAVSFIFAIVKLLAWKFGNAFFINDNQFYRSFRKKYSEEQYRESCLETAAESFLLALCVTFLAIILFVILLVFL